MHKTKADNLKNSLEGEIRVLVSEFSRCRIARIMPTTKIKDELGIDSFTALEILVGIENKYGIKISEKEINNLLEFEDIVNFVHKKIIKKTKK